MVRTVNRRRVAMFTTTAIATTGSTSYLESSPLLVLWLHHGHGCLEIAFHSRQVSEFQSGGWRSVSNRRVALKGGLGVQLESVPS